MSTNRHQPDEGGKPATEKQSYVTQTISHQALDTLLTNIKAVCP